IYNNPARSAVNIEIETLKRIVPLPHICGIKECASILQFAEAFACIKQIYPHFSLFGGDDLLALPVMALGADGIISGGATLLPVEMQTLISTCLKGDFLSARTLYFNLHPLLQALCVESNPIPLKKALELFGLPAGEPRLPLTPLNPKHLPILKKALEPWLNATLTS
ncbi:MAG: dihydrodipicolinate synthase family protein, partial [Chlamydiia bacterium]|nr:dihydrodipicolinate synthase family protein [Chlamydiia bacterium]